MGQFFGFFLKNSGPLNHISEAKNLLTAQHLEVQLRGHVPIVDARRPMSLNLGQSITREDWKFLIFSAKT